MKNIKLYLPLIMLLAFVSLPVTGFTQDEPKEDNTRLIPKQYKFTPEEQAKKIADKLKSSLELTDEQYKNIQKPFADRIGYIRELKSKDLISKSEIKQKKKEFRESINNILTKDQKKKFVKMMKKKSRRHHEKHRWNGNYF